MAQQTINSNSVQPLGEPNSGTSTEMGDTWSTAVTKLNAMFTDLYGTAGGIPAAVTAGSNAYTVVAGTTAAAITAQGVIDLSTVGDYTLAQPAAKGIFCEIIFRSTQGSTASGTNINLTASSATFDGLNTVARATAATVVNKALELISLSTTRWALLGNQGLTGTLGLATA